MNTQTTLHGLRALGLALIAGLVVCAPAQASGGGHFGAVGHAGVFGFRGGGVRGFAGFRGGFGRGDAFAAGAIGFGLGAALASPYGYGYGPGYYSDYGPDYSGYDDPAYACEGWRWDPYRHRRIWMSDCD